MNNLEILLSKKEKESMGRQVVAVDKTTLAKLHELKSRIGNVSIMKLTNALLLDGIERTHEMLDKKEHE